MPCMTATNLTPVQKAAQASAIERLAAALGAGAVTLKIGANGAVALVNWTDRAGVSDLCAYRALTAKNSPELRRALARAEALAGRKVSVQTVAAGVHSHDGGRTWHPGH